MKSSTVAVMMAGLAAVAHAEDVYASYGTGTVDPVPTTAAPASYAASTADPVVPSYDTATADPEVPSYDTAEPEAPTSTADAEVPTTTADVEVPAYGTADPVVPDYGTTVDPVDPAYTTSLTYFQTASVDPNYSVSEATGWGSWTDSSSASTVSTEDSTPTTSGVSSTTSCTESSATGSSTTVDEVSTSTSSEGAVYTPVKPSPEGPSYTTESPEQPAGPSGGKPNYGGPSASSVVYESTTTVTSTIYKTLTIYPTETVHVPASSWAEWASTPAWSSDGWWGGAWPTGGADQCVMNVVTGYGGEPSWIPDAPKPAAPTSEVYTTSVPAYAPSAPPANFYSSAAPSYEPAPSAPVESSTPPSSGGSGGMTPNGNYWGMTYSPYTADSGCKSQDTISTDIAKMKAKGFSSVRVYSTDCNTLQYVGEACKANGLKMIVGVFISSTGAAGAGTQVDEIVSWGQWDLVELIVVGNEAVFNGFISADDLATLINDSKGKFRGAGYNGPVTTTEDLATWTSQGSKWCGSVDVVAANLYAFFNPDTTPDKAGDLIEAQLQELAGVCGDKDTYVMESGWPTAGECNGKACPGVQEQATAIKSIQESNGAKVIFFSYENELWKTPGQYGVEQHWGCGDVFPG